MSGSAGDPRVEGAAESQRGAGGMLPNISPNPPQPHGDPGRCWSAWRWLGLPGGSRARARAQLGPGPQWSRPTLPAAAGSAFPCLSFPVCSRAPHPLRVGAGRADTWETLHMASSSPSFCRSLFFSFFLVENWCVFLFEGVAGWGTRDVLFWLFPGTCAL